MMMSSNSKDVGTHIPHPSQHPSPLLLRTLAPGSHLSELEIKKSRFLGYATSVTNWKVAQAYLISLQQEHPKARHWCFGYYAVLVAGGGGGSTAPEERSSDDGEPTGTAGLPILGAIKGEGLSNTMCVVVRYFGGIKLGAGNLLRTYGAAARQVLRKAPTVQVIPMSTFHIHIPSSAMAGAIYEMAHKVVGTILSDEHYGADGSFDIHVTCPSDQVERLQAMIMDATRGSAVFDDAIVTTSTTTT